MQTSDEIAFNQMIYKHLWTFFVCFPAEKNMGQLLEFLKAQNGRQEKKGISWLEY